VGPVTKSSSPWSLVAASLLLSSCGSDGERPAPPLDEGIFGFAGGCFAVEGHDGLGQPSHLAVTPAGDGFAFTEPVASAAARFTFRATDLGSYVLFDQDGRYFSAELSEDGAVRFGRPAALESELTLLIDGYRSPAEWRLEASLSDPRRYQLVHEQSEQFLTLSGLTKAPFQAAEITLLPQTDCAEFPELSIDAKGTVHPREWPDGDLYGIAEIHSHIFSNRGFGGGGTYHGAPFHRLGIEHALPDCSMWHGPEGRQDVVGFFFDGTASDFDIDELTGILTSGGASEFNHFTAGYPEFTAWPNSWGSSTHQTMYYRWIERAHLAGLRLIVQHATGNSVLCDLVNGINAQTGLYSCNDMVSVDRSIADARALERYIDAQAGGPGKGWLRIVESPQRAREVIQEGKLAMVLGIEISNLFDCFLTPPEGFEPCTKASVEEKIDHYRDLGVRAIFPVHKFDNAFTAGDGSGGVIEIGNLINSGHYSNFVEECPGIQNSFDGGGVDFGGLNQPRDDYDATPPLDTSRFAEIPVATLLPLLDELQEPPLTGDYCQKQGMTELGEHLMQELMARGMLIDIAHLPQKSMIRAYELLEDNDYPATKTHGNSNEGRIYRIGGLVGTSLGRCATPGQPGSMGNGLRNDVALAANEGAYPAEALSFDLNGFAGGPRPRFGDDSPCGEPQDNPVSYPFTSYDGNITFEEPQLGDRTVDFNTEGMIHIGLLPELIEDVRRDGVTDEELEPLFRSAEAYIRMWEHAEQRAGITP
jgi:hypothetical protein